jgi:formate dehydrogenase major subunit
MGFGKFWKTHVGMVPNPISAQTRQAHARIRGASASVSVCPYCAVGCSQVVYTKAGRVIDIEGNYESPINGGTLYPKGAPATSGLMHSPSRVTTVKYRAPYGDYWEERSLDWAMEQIAERVKQTRDASGSSQPIGGVTAAR